MHLYLEIRQCLYLFNIIEKNDHILQLHLDHAKELLTCILYEN
jgi:hypothetical protein